MCKGANLKHEQANLAMKRVSAMLSKMLSLLGQFLKHRC
jgi:hypothetical protein